MDDNQKPAETTTQYVFRVLEKEIGPEYANEVMNALYEEFVEDEKEHRDG